jgi:exosortase H (IPTLxxWG-CTERM-specific)
VVVFVLCLLAGYGLLTTPFLQFAVSGFSRGLVQASGLLIRACGGAASVDAAILRQPSTGFAIEMKEGCNGVTVMVLLCAAVLAFPATWIQRAVGILIGAAAIQALNFVRFISLFYLGQYSLRWFEFAHGYLWESLIMLDTLIIFSLWVKRIKGPHAG